MIRRLVKITPVLVLIILSLQASALDTTSTNSNLYFPIKSTRKVIDKPYSKAYNELEYEFFKHRLDTKNLPFFMTNYAQDTIWGYAKIMGPQLLQKKGVNITVNEMGAINQYTIKPGDVESLTIYYGSDSVKFRSVFFAKEILKKINKGKIDKSYYDKPLMEHERNPQLHPALLLELEDGYIFLLQYVIDENQSNSTYFIVYRNELYFYSYEYFLQKGFISNDIPEKVFYRIHPKFWIRLFNQQLSLFYQKE